MDGTGGKQPARMVLAGGNLGGVTYLVHFDWRVGVSCVAVPKLPVNEAMYAAELKLLDGWRDIVEEWEHTR